MKDWTPEDIQALRIRLDGYMRYMILGTLYLCGFMLATNLVYRLTKYLLS